MKIAIVTDSAADLTYAELQENNIYEISLPIIIGDTSYIAKERFKTNQEFYQFLSENEELPKTSQPTPGEMIAIFDKAKNDGYDAIFAITLSSGISGTFQTMRSVASEYDLPVEVFDSKIASSGQGNMAKYASKLVAGGINDLQELSAKVAELRDSTNAFIIVDDISHLQRTGRISGGSAMVAGLLNIKPVLSFDDGKIVPVARERQMKRAFKYVQDQFEKTLESYSDGWLVTIVDANVVDTADKWAEEIESTFPGVKVQRGEIGPLLGVHTGEKTIGFIYSRDYYSMS